jgi:uncharacterized SAM-binding protein YcdF (DUF218 family)
MVASDKIARRTGRRLTRSHMSVFMTLVVAVFALWFIGLMVFAAQIPTEVADPETPTDAIVVLTGGSGRLETGFTLLAERRARKLFVSGVYRGIDVEQLLQMSRRNPDELSCCVSLGYAAESTAGNAAESAAWIAGENFRSVRLVTANYHMPRSLLEFRHLMPDVEFIPNAVFPEHFKRNHWWAWPGSAALVVNEYTKFLLAWARHRAGDVFGPNIEVATR